MKLTETDIWAGLQELPGWALVEGRVEKTFAFDTYAEGVAFAVKVALVAEKANHHPDELSIGWCKVKVAYLTHSVGGVTQSDLDAAARVDSLY